MKIVSLDGQALNPGDLSWECFEKYGEVVVYPRTATTEETITRLQGADVLAGRTVLMHNKDIFLLQNLGSRQIIGDLNRHETTLLAEFTLFY